MDLKQEVNQTTSFDSNPPIALNKYDESIRQFCAAYESIFLMGYSFLRSMISEDAALLVVGAGTGMEICTFGSKNSNWRITGVDPSVEMLAIARQKIDSMKLTGPIKLFHGFTEELPDDDIYEGATCILVMHFLPDDGSKLALLRKHRKASEEWRAVNPG